MIKIAVIDDEPKARETIIEITGLSPVSCQVVGQAGSVSAGFDLIMQTKPDVVLLDINLPDGTGFDLLKKIESIRFSIIFITAHEEYAIKAFKFSAIDYLLKPITAGELLQAIEKAAEAIDRKENDLKFSTLLSNLEKIRKIVLKTAESVHIVQVKSIVRCEADVNYTSFFLENGQKLLVSRTLKEYDEMLVPGGFFRPHQSHLVNLEHVLRYDKADGGSLVMDDGSEVPVASRKREELMRLFSQM